MKTFNDKAGRTWTVDINVDAIKRVRSLLDVNLMAVIEGTLIEQLITDPVLLCDVIYVVCKPQADEAGVSDVEFGRAMGGDAIELATAALLEDLVDFFPQGRRRVLRKALKKLETVETRAIAAAETALDNPALDKRIEDELTSITERFSNSPPLQA